MYDDIEDKSLLPPSYESTEKNISNRNSFIKKVYTIVFLQLLTSIGVCYLFSTNQSIKDYIQGTNGEAMFITCMIFQFVVIIVLSCTNLHRNKPWNYILLVLFTLLLSYTLGVATSYYDTQTLLLAGGSTCLVTIGLTLYAFQTKYDFTGLGPYLLSLLLILLFMGVISIFYKNDVYNLVYSGIGALIFSFYIVYDTQLIIGGKSKRYKYADEDYIFAALSLYLDIINLFMYILDFFKN